MAEDTAVDEEAAAVEHDTRCYVCKEPQHELYLLTGVASLMGRSWRLCPACHARVLALLAEAPDGALLTPRVVEAMRELGRILDIAPVNGTVSYRE